MQPAIIHPWMMGCVCPTASGAFGELHLLARRVFSAISLWAVVAAYAAQASFTRMPYPLVPRETPELGSVSQRTTGDGSYRYKEGDQICGSPHQVFIRFLHQYYFVPPL